MARLADAADHDATASFRGSAPRRREFITQAMRQRGHGGGFDFQDLAAHGHGAIRPVSGWLKVWFIGGLAFMMEPNYSNRASPPHIFLPHDRYPAPDLCCCSPAVVWLRSFACWACRRLWATCWWAAVGPHALGWVPDTDRRATWLSSAWYS
jgi:hypothetical protein